MSKAMLNQLIVYAIISFGGWLFAYIGVSGIREARKRQEAENAVTTAKVVEHVKYQKRSRRRHRSYVYTYWRAVMEFDAEGRHYRLEGVVQEGKPAVGETVRSGMTPTTQPIFTRRDSWNEGSATMQSSLCSACCGAYCPSFSRWRCLGGEQEKNAIPHGQ